MPGNKNNVSIKVDVDAKSIKELRADLKELKKQFESARPNTPEFQKYKTELDATKLRIRELNGTLNSTHQRYFELGTQIREATALLGKFTLAALALNQLKEFAEGAARVEMLRNQLDALVKQEGASADLLLTSLRQATNGTVSDLQLLQKALELKLVGTPLAQIPGIIKFIDERADTLGKTFDEVADSLIRMSVGGGERVVRELRIPVDVEEAYKSFAEQIGTTADMLNEAGERQALFNAIMARGSEQQQGFASASTASMDAVERLDTAFVNLKNSGLGLLSVLTPMIDFFGKLIKSAEIGFRSISKIVEMVIAASSFNFERVRQLAEEDAELGREFLETWNLRRGAVVDFGAVVSTTTSQNKKNYIDEAKVLKGAMERGRQEMENDLERRREIADANRELWDLMKEYEFDVLDDMAGQVDKETKRILDAFRESAEDAAEIGRQFGVGFADGIASGEAVLKSALKRTLTTILDYLERKLILAKVENAVANFAILGPFGLIKAAAESALIATLFETAKAAVMSFAHGGLITEKVYGVGERTGRRYILGEAGDEYVVPKRQVNKMGMESRFGDKGLARLEQAIRQLPTRFEFRQRGRDLVAVQIVNSRILDSNRM